MNSATARVNVCAQTKEADERYVLALCLVERIDHGLEQCMAHYRDRQGQLLVSLDQVVGAILGDELREETDHAG